MKTPRILFLGKRGDEHCSRALSFLRLSCPGVEAYLGAWGDPRPAAFEHWRGDYIVSYLSRWVAPPELLDRAEQAAINFHPATPHYPGIGCVNFALYEGAREYGATCHHMAPAVDTGEIIAVKRFPVVASDGVASLLHRSYDYQLVLFYEMALLIARGASLPSAGEAWTRKPFTREQFNKLGRIDPSMDAGEVARRVRATSFGVHQPTVTLGGHVFEHRPRGSSA